MLSKAFREYVAHRTGALPKITVRGKRIIVTLPQTLRVPGGRQSLLADLTAMAPAGMTVDLS